MVLFHSPLQSSSYALAGMCFKDTSVACHPPRRGSMFRWHSHAFAWLFCPTKGLSVCPLEFFGFFYFFILSTNLVFPRLSSHKRKGRKIGEYGKIYEAALPASYRFPEDREAQISQKKSVYRGHAWKKQLGRYPANHVKTNHPLLGTPH